MKMNKRLESLSVFLKQSSVLTWPDRPIEEVKNEIACAGDLEICLAYLTATNNSHVSSWIVRTSRVEPVVNARVIHAMVPTLCRHFYVIYDLALLALVVKPSEGTLLDTITRMKSKTTSTDPLVAEGWESVKSVEGLCMFLSSLNDQWANYYRDLIETIEVYVS